MIELAAQLRGAINRTAHVDCNHSRTVPGGHIAVSPAPAACIQQGFARDIRQAKTSLYLERLFILVEMFHRIPGPLPTKAGHVPLGRDETRDAPHNGKCDRASTAA